MRFTDAYSAGASKWSVAEAVVGPALLTEFGRHAPAIRPEATIMARTRLEGLELGR